MPPLAFGPMRKLNRQQQKELLQLARQTLAAAFRHQPLPQFQPDAAEKQPAGAFVTLKKNGQLRGCIGQIIGHQPLWQTVQQMALAAAFDDPRFPPLRREELPAVEIEISVLSPPQPVASPAEIDLQNEGVILELHGRQGVFLPQVAQETGWDRETLLGQLCQQKLGLGPDCWRDPAARIFSFATQSFSEATTN